MKKLTKKQREELRGNLKKIEKVINDKEQYELENGCYLYKFTLCKNNIKFVVLDDDEEFYDFYLGIEFLEDLSVKTICKFIIKYIYGTEINFRQKFIKNSKNVKNRKIKSLVLWMSREKEEKVKQINNELVEHYNKVQKYNNELAEYKEYVRDIYRVLWNLCPQWKVENVCEYVKERFEYFNVKDVDVTTLDNKIVVRYGEYNLTADVDSFSKNDSVFRILNLKIKMIQELEAAC